MKIHRFLKSMFKDGKIRLYTTPGLSSILTDKNFQILRNLKLEDDGHYLWLPTEQLVALPRIQEVEVDGRSGLQNETLLIPIHDYIQLTQPFNHFSKYFSPILEGPPENFEVIEVNEA